METFTHSTQIAPNCRSIIEIAPSGIESLPVNFALRAIIEKYQQEDHPDIITCPRHYRQPLNVYCLLDKIGLWSLPYHRSASRSSYRLDLQSAYMKEKGHTSKTAWTVNWHTLDRSYLSYWKGETKISFRENSPRW